MTEFMKTLLSLSVSGTLLLLLICGFKKLYKNRFSKRWQYYIWIIPVLRFLLPFTPGAAAAGDLFEKPGTAAITAEIPTGPDTPDSVNAADMESATVQTDKNPDASAMRKPLNPYTCLFFIWSALALLLFVHKIAKYQRFIRYIQTESTEISDTAILNLLSDCKEKLNIKIRVELSCHPLISSPMMTGFFHPRIVLPDDRLEDKKLFYIFMHELTHYRQKDLFYKWLIQIVICVHWFNPFVYLLEKEVNKACELSCDEKVISSFDKTERIEYGDILISFLKSDNHCRNSFASVTLTEGAAQIKERLGAIMKYRKKSKSVTAATVMFSAAVCICFFVTGAYASSSSAENHSIQQDDISDMTDKTSLSSSAESHSIQQNDISEAMDKTSPNSAADRHSTWKDGEILNDVLTEDGVYYIFCDGAEESDKPKASVSAGSIQFVIVRKGSYTSIGPFDDMDTLLEDTAKQCAYMKNLTEKEKESVMKTAAKAYADKESKKAPQSFQTISIRHLSLQPGSHKAYGRYTFKKGDLISADISWNETGNVYFAIGGKPGSFRGLETSGRKAASLNTVIEVKEDGEYYIFLGIQGTETKDVTDITGKIFYPVN